MSEDKFLLKKVVKETEDLRLKNKRIVLLFGSFDILHIGHLDILNKAKKFGDILVVGVNSDAHVRKRKGEKRPIISECQRADMVLGLKPVDYVFITNDKPCIPDLLPDVFVTTAEKGEELEKIKRLSVIKENIPNLKIECLIEIKEEGQGTTEIINKIISKLC